MERKSVIRLASLMAPATFLWAGAFIAAKFSVNQIPLLTLTAARFFFALIPIMIMGLATKSIVLPKTKHLPLLFFLSLTGMIGYHTLFFYAMKHTTASNASLIVALIPLMTVVLSRIFLNAKIYVSQLLCFALSLSGVVLVITNGDFGVILSGNFNSGDLVILAAALSFAVYSVFQRKALGVYSPLNVLIYVNSISIILLLPFCIAEKPGNAIMNLDMRGWLAVIYMGVLSSGIGYLLQSFAIKDFGPSRTMIFNNLVPIFSIFLAALILGEQITWIACAALVLIVTGLLSNSYISARREKQNAGGIN